MTDFRISVGGTLAGYSGSDTSVTVPSTVSKVGALAFRNMPVTSVTLPAATTEIRDSAFADCTQLASVTIPSTQKIIAANAFTGTQILSAPYSPQVTTTTVQWSAPLNSPRGISSYNLYINGQQSSSASPSINLSQLTAGQTASLQIAAVDSAGEGIRSPLLSYATTGSPWEESGSIASSPAKIATSAKGHLVAIADVSSSDVSLYTIQANGSWLLTETLAGTGAVGSIAMSGDGKTAVIARTADIRIYTESAGTWTLLTTLSVQSAQVALSTDGTTLAVGVSSGDGTVSLYQKVSSTWTLKKTLYGTMDSSENFGCSVALSADGAILAVGAKYALGKGAVRIFTGRDWRNQANIYGEEASSEQFGYSVALSADGQTVAVGSPCMGTLNSPTEPMTGYGAVTVWTKPTLTWTKAETFYRGTGASDMFGTSVALNGTGTTLVVGSAAAGVSVYAVNGAAWPLVGAFTDAAPHVCASILGDRIFCGTSSAVKSYTYRTQRLNVVPSVTSLLRAAVVQDATTAETAAQSLISDMLQYESATGNSLTSDFITQFATCLPSATDAKKQASLTALLLVGNLMSETQNDIKADIADACVQTIGFTADSYIGISAEYIDAILQSAEHVGSYTPTTLYVFFPSTTTFTMNSSYKNAIYYLEPDVTYTVGSTTLDYRRRSELQQILLGLPNSNTFTAPFRAPNPDRPIFSADARRYRLENQYAQLSLLESATYWQQQILESPATLLNYEIMAWIAVDMLLSTDTATHEYGRALATKYIPIARGLKQVAAFSQGGEDDFMDAIPTDYFVGAADGSIAYPESISLTHTTPISRIDAGAFDTAIKQLIFGTQVFTVSGGNITLPYNATRIWSINLNGPEILLPGAPAHVPSNGIIDISANVEYIPPGYFADSSSATHVRFPLPAGDITIIVGAGAFPSSCALIDDSSRNLLLYRVSGSSTKDLLYKSGILYMDYETTPTPVGFRTWLPKTPDNTIYILYKDRNVQVPCVSGTELILESDASSDIYNWSNRIVSSYTTPLALFNGVLKYENTRYSLSNATAAFEGIPSLIAPTQTVKLLPFYHNTFGPTQLLPFENTTISLSPLITRTTSIPSFVKGNNISNVFIPFVNDWDQKATNGYYLYNITKGTKEHFLNVRYDWIVSPLHYVFTNTDLDNGQTFTYGNLEWINSSDPSGLRISAVYTTPATNGAVYLMPGACSLYANMFGAWASSVTSVEVYNPSLRITTSIPAYTFKNCTNLATHGFTFRDSIGVSAFESCSSLTAPVTISSTGGMAIGANAFKGCAAIPSITIDCSGAVSIGANAFAGCSGLTSITVKGSTVSIDTSAFTGCTGVQTITVTNLASTAPPFPFASMTGLQTVQISLAGAVTLSTMTGLTSLTAVTVTGSSTLTIASNQFSGCSALQTLNVSAPLAGMTTSALSGCTALQTLALNFASGATAALNALTGFTSLTSIQVTGGAALTLPSTFCNSLTALTTVSLTSNTLSVPGDGNLFNGASGLQTLTAVVATNPSAGTFQVNSTLSGLKTLSLTGAITVAGSAFWDNSVLESLTIRGTRSGTLGTLPSSTVQTINVNHDVSQSITAYRFMNYPVLSSVNITPLLDISEGAFFGCANLLSFNFGAASAIGDLAFANSGISGEVVIPESMGVLGSSYFVGCPNLKKITYNCDLVMFNDPTTLEVTYFNRLMYYNVDTNGLGNYYVNGTANLTRGEDLSYNIVYAPSSGGSDVTIDNSSLFSTINWTQYKNRHTQLNELIKVLSTYTDNNRDIYFIDASDSSGNYINIDNSGNVTIRDKTNNLLYTSGPRCTLAIDTQSLVVKDISDNIVYNDGNKRILKVVDYPTERTHPSYVTGDSYFYEGSDKKYYKYRLTDNYTAWIKPFIYKLQEISEAAVENDTTQLSNLSTFAGWNGSQFTELDASANAFFSPMILTPSTSVSRLNAYNSSIYPSAVTYFNAAMLANTNLFSVNQTDPSASFVKPYAIPEVNCILKLPQNRINHITSESDISLNGVNTDIFWNNTSPSIVFNDGTVIDISGSLTRRLTENISSEFSSIVYWLAQNIESITGDNSVAISISNLLTSIDDMTNKINTTIDISCGLLTIFDSAMTDFDNTTLNIVTPSISIGNGAFTSWTNGSTLNLTTNTEPFVGVDVFNYSNNIIVNSNKFLINTPTVKLVDFSNVTLDNVPALISAHTDVSANYTRNVEIGTYMPPTTTGFARGYTYIKFQEIPTLKQYILLQKPEDWFWAYHDGQLPYGQTGVGGLKYINCVEGDEIFEQTGLMHNIAPSSFSFMGYRFTRNVSFNSSVTQPNTYFRAIKNNGDVQKKALFRNSGSGRVLYQAAPILIAVAVQLLVAALTFGVGAALSGLLFTGQMSAAQIATATAIKTASMLAIGGGIEIGAAFLTQAANTSVETGTFMLGNLTPLFWVEVAAGALGVLAGIFKLLRLIKLPGRTVSLVKPARWGVPKKFPTKMAPKKPRWGDMKKFPTRNPKPKNTIIKSVVSDTGGGGGSKFVDDAPMFELPPASGPNMPPVKKNIINKIIDGVPKSTRKIIDDPEVLIPDQPPMKLPPKPTPPAKPVVTIASIVDDVGRVSKLADDIGDMPADKAFLKLTIDSTINGVKRVPLPGVKLEEMKYLQYLVINAKKGSETHTFLAKQLDDISKLEPVVLDASPVTIFRNADLISAIASAKNVHLINMMNHMYLTNNITSASSAYDIANRLKSKYTMYETPTNPITLNQYSDFNAQITTPILGVIGPSGESYIGNATYSEVDYEDAYDKAIAAQYPPYIFPVTGTPMLDVQETNSCYQMSTYQTMGTNYEHPYSTRIPEGYPCKPATTAGPLLTNSNYLWNQLYLGSPRTANNLEYNNLWPGNLWSSYDSVIITATEDINTEIYLGNRTVEYTSSILERPNLVYSGARNINILLPPYVTSIPAYAFNSTDGTDGSSPFTVTTAFIPPSVTSIGTQAFYRSGLKTLIYPTTATRGDYVFANSPIERVISLSSSDTSMTHYRDGDYSISVVVNNSTHAVTSPGVVALYGFTSAQISRNGVVVDSIPNGAGKWIYLQNITSISESGLTINPKQVLSYKISTAWLNINGYALYDSSGYMANKTIAQPLYETNLTTESPYFKRALWEQTRITGTAKENQAPFNSYTQFKTTSMTVTFSGVSIVRTGTGTTSTTTPRARAAPTTIAPYAFFGNEQLTHCDIEPTCTEIGDGAYERCKNLQGVINIPNGVTKIGAHAFAGTNIGTIVIPPTVQEIGVSAIPATTAIVLVPDEDEKISPGFNIYCITPEPITNRIYSASSNVLRDLSKMLPSSQLRVDLPPLSPVNVKATGSDRTITVAWENFTVPYSSGASAHRIECVAENEEPRVFENDITNPFAISELTNGVEYTISITAINGAGARAPTVVKATPMAS